MITFRKGFMITTWLIITIVISSIKAEIFLNRRRYWEWDFSLVKTDHAYYFWLPIGLIRITKGE